MEIIVSPVSGESVTSSFTSFMILFLFLDLIELPGTFKTVLQ